MRISDWSSDVCSSDLFADFEGTLGDAAIVEAEDTVDAAEAVGGHQPVHRKAGSRLPVAGDADGQQHRIIAEAGQPIGRLAIAATIFGRELALEAVGDAGARRGQRLYSRHQCAP